MQAKCINNTLDIEKDKEVCTENNISKKTTRHGKNLEL